MRLTTTRCRRRDPRQDLQHRALARAVPPDDPHGLAGLHLERDVLQRPEVARRALLFAPAARRQLRDIFPQRPVPTDALRGADAIALADVLDPNREIR